MALLGAGTATASTTTTTTTTTTTAPSSPSSASGSSDASGSASSLGGYQISATGAGVTWTYEQPNFPVPAVPTLELHLGYSTSSYNSGPTGESIASTLWPGQVAANIGGQLSTLLQPYLGANTPNITVPPWPLEASTSYPPGPTTPGSASEDSPGVTMESSTTEDAGDASATFGTSSSSTNDNSYALPSGFISIQTLGSTVQSTVANGEAVAQGTSEVHGVSIAGGLITIGAITSTATSTSDGNKANVTGASTVSQVTVAGQAVTLDSTGLNVVGNSAPVLGSVLPSVQQLLESLGISLALTNPTDTVNGASGQRELDGVQLQINLTTLDKEASTLAAMLPKQVQSQVISNLPVPIPDSQVLTVDLGDVNVSAAATPPYDAGASSSTGDDSGDSALSGVDSGTSGLGSEGLATGTGTGTAYPTIAGSTGSTPSAPSTSPASASGLSAVARPAPAALFKGIGAGLIVLGVLLAMLVAGALWKADSAVGALTAAPPCVGEKPETLLGGTQP
jgi:hypothetical protein